MIHGGQLLRPAGLGVRDQRLAVRAAGIARRRGQAREQLLSNQLGVALDPDFDPLGQADAIGVDVDLDQLGILGPVVDTVTRQGRERVQARPQRQHHVGLGDQLHGCFGSVVAQRAAGQRMRAGEGVVMLVVAAHGRIEALGQLDRSRNGPAQHNARTIENNRELGFGQQCGCAVDRVGVTRRATDTHDLRQVDVDHLGPEVTRHVDLCRS